MYQRRLSILQWETLAATIANGINNMPLALGSVTADLENLDILTSNRLKLGCNNDRSPVRPVNLVEAPSKIMEENRIIYESWFENWLMTHVPKLLNQEKWFTTENSINVGDTVLFVKQESKLSSDYQYGLVYSSGAW